ncbi:MULTISPECIES: tripartite tricarboxylate transporter substrate binding protein [unclassified Bradyrhizobium]|uniref:Bug family tripartite tricarboxylate transporter substrate binding protein n=1 Tax=unclassified Bradyrhizobium TaxID=2631580 RepID=UPI001CD7FA6A|nr:MULTISPECIES: tripartite tricarboxylate transporter substrate binding protein [unclassified Bradyrhizobium]MCA1428821.1 tripartite tricarboxylate transporter substrate binding protein [Bradyrhizobium sp. NBAIM16]MCA1508201.1 tripartite tricarboxylate transporter substrate binding protein [Bradyrhizobium sp. NBAIM02]
MGNATLLSKIRFGAAGILLLAATSMAYAAWPERNITFIVPFPAGGSSDMVARAIGQKVSDTLRQPVVVENRSGATGALGATAVARAPADGYTVLVGSIGVYATNPFLQPNLKYDPLKDFDLLTVAVRAPNVLVANLNFPANTVAELVEQLKKAPGKITFASSGAGSSDHLTAALFWQRTGTTGLHVPYRGGAPAVSDLLAGHVNVSFQNINAVIGQIQSKQLKVLAITGDARSPLLPEVPTLKELGIEGVDVFSWQAVAAPKGLPADVKAKLHGEIVAALKAPDVRKRMEDIGLEIVANTPEQFQEFLVSELARWKRVIEAGNITVE